MSDSDPRYREPARAAFQQESYVGNDWIETFTGRQFRPMAPDWRAFNLFDIAHALSNKCRYGGHVKTFYSVAEHCCLLAAHARGLGMPVKVQLEFLSHDWTEGYFPDTPRPVKQFVPEMVAGEKRVGAMLRDWIGLDGPVPPIVHEWDARIIRDERAVMMQDTQHPWMTDSLEPLGINVRGLAPRAAEVAMLGMMGVLLQEHIGREVLVFYPQHAWGDRDVRVDNDKMSTHDILQVDLLGNVGLCIVKDEEGRRVRDRGEGFPTPKTKWVHGQFQLITPGA